MLRKRDSRTLKRIANSQHFIGYYHKTPTLVHDKSDNKVTFRDEGWNTPSTYKSQTFFLEDIGLANLRVGVQKGLAYLFVKNNKVPIARINNETVMLYPELQNLNERGC